MRRALILAALLSSGCSLHMSAELLNPLNKGEQQSLDRRPACPPRFPKPCPVTFPTPAPTPVPYSTPEAR